MNEDDKARIENDAENGDLRKPINQINGETQEYNVNIILSFCSFPVFYVQSYCRFHVIRLSIIRIYAI